MLQVFPDTESHPTQVAVIAVPVGVAAMLTGEFTANVPLHGFTEHPRPGGLLATVPVPVMSTVRTGFEPPDEPKQTTLAVICPKTIAPDELRPPLLVLV
jgi:hypothetical protein